MFEFGLQTTFAYLEFINFIKVLFKRFFYLLAVLVRFVVFFNCLINEVGNDVDLEVDFIFLHWNDWRITTSLVFWIVSPFIFGLNDFLLNLFQKNLLLLNKVFEFSVEFICYLGPNVCFVNVNWVVGFISLKVVLILQISLYLFFS